MFDERDRIIPRRVSFERDPMTGKLNVASLESRLRQAWSPTAIKIPTKPTLNKIIRGAIRRSGELLKARPEYAEKLSFILVPPTTKLDTAVALSELKPIYRSVDLDSRPKYDHWRVIVVADNSCNVPISDLQQFKKSGFLSELPYDVKALGIDETLAAELQGHRVALPDEWTVLLKESTVSDQVLCVSKEAGNIVFDVDDVNCLLGKNHLTIAVEV